MICESCEGTGGNSYSYDPSPAGVGLPSGTMEDWAECTTCGGLGITDPEPCPFCGGTALTIEMWKSPLGHEQLFVECQDCLAAGPRARLQEDACKMWEDR